MEKPEETGQGEGKEANEPYYFHGGAHAGHKGAHSGPAKGKIKAEGEAATLLGSMPSGAQSAAYSAGMREVKVIGKGEMNKIARPYASGNVVAGTYDDKTGTLYLLKDQPNMQQNFAHEFAHSLDPFGPGSSKYSLSENKEWLDAGGWKADKKGQNYKLKTTIENQPTSNYGKTAPWEDFAESFTKYTTGSKFDRRVMQGESEKRYAYMEKFAKSLGFE